MKLVAACFLAGILTAACVPTSFDATSGSVPTTTPAPSEPTINVDPFTTLTNDARSVESLNPLEVDTLLGMAAQGHADDMSINDYFSHTSQDGRTLGDRVSAVGYDYCWAGENIAYGYSSQASVFAAWMNSPGHRANILSSNATEYGLGHAADGNYWVMVLGRPGC